MTEFEKRVEVFPGYDHRDDPRDTRGAHNLSIRFTIIGPLGAITWDLNTGWMERPLLGAYQANAGQQRRSDTPGADHRLRDYSPRAGAVSSHAHDQLEDYWVGPQPCNVLGGECYGDTGYTIGDTVLAAMFKDGHDGIWRELRVIYDAWLAAAPVTA
jgi:hypothetical protein